MQNKVRTAIIGLPQDHARQLHAFLRRVVDVALVREDPRDAMSPLLVARPQAVLLYLAEADGVGIQFARRMRSELPDTALVLLCHVEDVTLTREAMRLGARALIVVGKDDDDLARTFVKIAEEQRSDMPGGEVVTVLGSKGGVGATSLAINLAGALAIDPNLRVALIDLSPYLGEIGVYLQLDTTVSPRTLVRESLMIDDEWMQNAVPRHSLGFSVFAQPLKPGAPPLNVADIAQSIGILRRLFSHVVIDAGTGGSELGFAALAVASKPLLVMGGDTPSLVAAQRALHTLKALGQDPRRIWTVLNAAAPEPVDAARARSILGADPTLTFPHDRKAVDVSLHTGRLVVESAPESELTQAFLRAAMGMCDDYRPAIQAGAGGKRKKLFGLF